MYQEKTGTVTAIVGLQYGSEGKGALCEYLCPMADIIVRIGASNAGHTVMYHKTPYVMRTIPCGWINPDAKLVIGISSVISLQILLNEIEIIHKILPIKDRLLIDGNAHVITDDQIYREMQTGLAERISSTSAKSGLGIGMAMADKVLRDPRCRFAKDVPELQDYICDTVDFLNNQIDFGSQIILEGTQGFGLSLEHGFFPYVTSRDTTAQALFAGTGLNPYGFNVQVIGVMRAYPIRVGGPSGLFDSDSEEISWQEVAKRAGDSRDITEKTSVTKSIRRVATPSMKGIERACRVNRVSEIALTFADHIDAKIYETDHLSEKVFDFIRKIESKTGVSVGFVKTGPHNIIDLDPYRQNLIRRVA